jgi:hypothetical protein
MNNEKIFKTKTGFCHILPDMIILTRDSVVGDVSKMVVGTNIARSLIIYGLISVWVLYFSYSSYLNGKIVLPLFLGLTAVGLIVAIIKSLNNSATPIIQRDKIISVKFKNEIVRVTRSRFEVLFENEKHKIKKRLIMLPGSMNDGTNETIKALEIMREEGLID